jgi:phage virion morphogenesis protein
MAVIARIDDREVRIGLGEFRAGVGDKSALLKIVGDLMTASIARTFRDEGSPAGSWPALALSTLRSKKYKGIHKLLVLSGRLFRSITYAVSGDTLTIGTNVVYARVHQFGSADRMGGSIGPQAKLPDRRVLVSNYDALRIHARQYGHSLRTGKDGKQMNVRMRLQGPLNATRYHVGEHSRHQNISARPYLVFRPEDPARFVSGIEAYLGLHAVRIGKVVTA